jgi:fatty acid desaturase
MSTATTHATRGPLAVPGDWRTVLLAVVIHGGWLAVVLGHGALPWWATVALLGWFGAWHLSLVHELVHGHPFRSRALNELLGGLPLTLWVPYRSFRHFHLAHHDTVLTHPTADPESYYALPERWAQMDGVRRAIHRANRTAAFRLTVWAVVSTVAFTVADVWRAVRGRPGFRAAWLAHLVGVAVVLHVVVRVGGMPVWEYLLGGVLLARSLNMVRSFAEHLSLADPNARTAQIRAGRAMSLLMLHNNLHVAHHDAPGLAWYEVPAHSRRIGADEIAARGGGLYRGGYTEVFRRFGFRPFDQPVYGAGSPVTAGS